jgi:hypothetical protein
MEITILLESTEPLAGRVITGSDDLPDCPRTETRFMGWLSLLRALDDLIGSSSNPLWSVE